MAKTVSSNSAKFKIYDTIKSKHHLIHSGDFSHYALFLPTSKDADYWEKGLFW